MAQADKGILQFNFPPFSQWKSRGTAPSRAPHVVRLLDCSIDCLHRRKLTTHAHVKPLRRLVNILIRYPISQSVKPQDWRKEERNARVMSFFRRKKFSDIKNVRSRNQVPHIKVQRENSQDRCQDSVTGVPSFKPASPLLVPYRDVDRDEHAEEYLAKYSACNTRMAYAIEKTPTVTATAFVFWFLLCLGCLCSASTVHSSSIFMSQSSIYELFDGTGIAGFWSEQHICVRIARSEECKRETTIRRILPGA